MPMIRRVLPITALMLLAACQSQTVPVTSGGKSAALLTMEHVAIAAHSCWFASKDPAFKPYHMANELNSFSGQPRFLLVPAKHPESKPLLVVQAQGPAANLQAFGPLMQEPLGARIAGDLKRWAAGSSSCAATS
jgi:hypothetical protein